MKLILISSILALTSVSLADNCQVGLDYCGSSLLGRGKYQPQIDQCIFDNSASSQDSGFSTLFTCEGGANGVIKYIKDCGIGKCHDGGSGKSDSCN